MLKILIKKQMAEIFRMYFYDRRKNTARSVAATAAYFLLFACLMIGMVGGMFGFLAYNMRTVLQLPELSWFYFSVFGLIAIVFGLFGSVFNTYSALYLAKDNDLILSLPISVNTVITARLIGVYLTGLLFSSAVIVPSFVIFYIYGTVTLTSVIGTILFLLIVSVMVFLLSCILGYAVARISVKLKNKSLATVLISLVLSARIIICISKPIKRFAR